MPLSMLCHGIVSHSVWCCSHIKRKARKGDKESDGNEEGEAEGEGEGADTNEEDAVEA